MKKFFHELLLERSQLSSMRFLAICSLFIGGAIAAYALYANKDLSGTSMLCGVFVSAAFCGKVGQKYLEVKSADKPE